MPSPSLALLQALVASSSGSTGSTGSTTTTTTAPSGVLGSADQVASSVNQSGGWLYHLLTKAG